MVLVSKSSSNAVRQASSCDTGAGAVPPRRGDWHPVGREAPRLVSGGTAVAAALTSACATGTSGLLGIQPIPEGLPERIWWGAGGRESARWVAEQGMNIMSSTLLLEDTGVPFDELQAEQIEAYREAWREAGWERTPRVSVSRSVIPITSDLDRLYFGRDENRDQIGRLDGHTSRFGRTYTREPDVIASELAEDRAVQAADTVLLTVPNQLGVKYNAQILGTIARDVAPALGWRAKGARA